LSFFAEFLHHTKDERPENGSIAEFPFAVIFWNFINNLAHFKALNSKFYFVAKFVVLA
jgi:hypothetical protein